MQDKRLQLDPQTICGMKTISCWTIGSKIFTAIVCVWAKTEPPILILSKLLEYYHDWIGSVQLACSCKHKGTELTRRKKKREKNNFMTQNLWLFIDGKKVVMKNNEYFITTIIPNINLTLTIQDNNEDLCKEMFMKVWE